MNSFIQPLTEYSVISDLKGDIMGRKLPVRVTGCIDAQKSNLIAAVSSNVKRRLIIAENDQKAREIAAVLLGKNQISLPCLQGGSQRFTVQDTKPPLAKEIRTRYGFGGIFFANISLKMLGIHSFGEIQPCSKENGGHMPAICFWFDYLYLRLRAASDFFFLFTDGFS